MDSVTLILGGLLTILFLIYWYITRNNNYWESRGVKCIKPNFFFGNLKDSMLMKISVHEFVRDFYNKMKGEPYAGMYEGTRPILVVFDPELIKLVLVKHFDHFVDRPMISFGKDTHLEKMMAGLQGAEWKRTRVACTPAFSSGRLKAMVPLINACAQQMVNHLNKITKEKGDTIQDMKLLLINFTLDVIASTSFGINLDSFSNKESDFAKYALQVQDVGLYKRLLMLFCILLEVPNWLKKLIPLSFFNYDTIKFLEEHLIQTKNYRLTHNVRRNDLLQLLIDAQAEPVEVIGETDEEISNEKRERIDEETAIAQSIFFFIAGFETTSTHLTMAFYELAKNKDIQEKVRKEILEHWSDDGDLTYEGINSMTYLDMVMSETLRLYPPLAAIERMVTKPIELDGLKLEYGTKIILPTIGLQHDSEYFPDPQCFNPERFTQEEKQKRSPYLFLAFGAGPRNCIGLRFGSMNSKICAAYLLKHFEIDVCDKTPIPFEYDRQAFFLKSKDEIYLKFSRIN